ncbi:MAG: hypothetical protein WC299_02650 [Kiritimatiellia bacterium]
MIKIRINFLFCILPSAFCIFLLMAGCARLGPGLKKGIPVAAPRGLEIHAQYAASSGSRSGYNTFEVYIANHTDETITFTGAELNGKPLPKVEQDKIDKLFAVSLGEGDEIPLTEPGYPEDSPVTWWQYYPSPELKPGEAIEFQANFKVLPSGRQSLSLIPSASSIENLPSVALAKEGRKPALRSFSEGGSETCPAPGGIENTTVSVPRYHPPAKLITAVTYTLDGKRMFVQYASHKVPLKKIFVNGKRMNSFKVYEAPQGGSAADRRGPADLAAVSLPRPVGDGDSLHVSMEFEDGEKREALVRVLLGIALDGSFKQGQDEKSIRNQFALDDYSKADMLPFDVACSDVKTGRKGMSAPSLASGRLKAYENKIHSASGGIRNQLQAVNYCAAYYSELGDIYGQICDVVYAKPYQLSWGKHAERFIEAEDIRAAEEAQSAQPRPWMWVPDRFKRSGRYMASGELEVLAWMMLVKGAKGVRYHYWNEPSEKIMAEHPWLLTALPDINREISKHISILAPLVPAGETMLEKEKIKIYESWSGDRGVLVMARNLDYRTISAAVEKNGPRFEVADRDNVNITIRPPHWLGSARAVDLLSGDKLPVERTGDYLMVKLGKLYVFRLIWLE